MSKDERLKKYVEVAKYMLQLIEQEVDNNDKQVFANIHNITEDIDVETKVSNDTEDVVDYELLATRIGESYTTKHPEYSTTSQLNNIKSMVNSSKITYIINWIRKTNIEGLENFFNKNDDEKKYHLNMALEFFPDKIKEILAKRFAL